MTKIQFQLSLTVGLVSLLSLVAASPSLSKSASASSSQSSPSSGASSEMLPSFRQAGPSQYSSYNYPQSYYQAVQQFYQQNPYGAGAGSGGIQAAASSPVASAIRPLRRSSFTSKIRNLVNSIFFRGYTKPNYTPTTGFGYDESVASKPFYLSQNSYKPITIPYRQLQKYYKPYSAAASSMNPTYASPYGSSSQSAYGALSGFGGGSSGLGNGVFGSGFSGLTSGLTSGLSGLTASASNASPLTSSVFGGGSGYSSYPVQGGYNLGSSYPSAAAAYGSTYKRSSTGGQTYSAPAPPSSSTSQTSKVSYPKS